ncbi:hypothetical protein X777_06804 [Ooceraea biroi]|uniref:Uncharacterized protein n=1 Tax=Ooceraea biroi TaxID=2015173 RepID=A0A026WCA9_OOCBI|nr:hypothetical protein X777_06804 [Ooceraea biroi]
MLVIVTSSEVNTIATTDAGTSFGDVNAEEEEILSLPEPIIAKLCKKLCEGRLPGYLREAAEENLPRYKRFCKCDDQVTS